MTSKDQDHIPDYHSPGVIAVQKERTKQFQYKRDDSRTDPEALVALALDFIIPRDMTIPAVPLSERELYNFIPVLVDNRQLLRDFGWDPDYVSSAHRHTRKEQLITGAALLVAAYDRIVSLEYGQPVEE